MSYCKVCATSHNVSEEELLDGRHIHLCGVCRRYLQGLLRTRETCADCKICMWSSYDFGGICDDWKDTVKGDKK